jgi:hypothetical protein
MPSVAYAIFAARAPDILAAGHLTHNGWNPTQAAISTAPAMILEAIGLVTLRAQENTEPERWHLHPLYALQGGRNPSRLAVGSVLHLRRVV